MAFSTSRFTGLRTISLRGVVGVVGVLAAASAAAAFCSRSRSCSCSYSCVFLLVWCFWWTPLNSIDTNSQPTAPAAAIGILIDLS